MNSQMQEILQRREKILGKIEQQREQLVGISKQLSVPAAFVDRVWFALKIVRAYPAIVAGVGALFVVRRRGTIGLFKLVLKLWKGYRFLNNLAAKLPFIKK